ncbi:hypothetical protein BJ944DRAFT_237100 [Cunninghamella echinulata]|nr:hypothetical protein BJ944DRAFT_237100 [Cunninghamella echinulata]
MHQINIIIYAYPVDNSNIYAADIIATTNNACLNKDNDNDKNNNPCPTTTTKPSSPSSTSTIQPTSTDDSPSPYPVYGNDSTVTVQMGVLGGLFIVLGLYLMALGFRGFRITMLIMGFLLFGKKRNI